MEHAYRLAAASGLLVAVAAVSALGCHPHDCGYYGMTCSGAGTEGAGGAGADAGDTGAPANCDPTDGTTNLLKAACGVFVRADGSDVMGDGTPDHAYKTFAKSLADIEASVASKPWREHIYACNAGPFEETVTVGSKVVLHGGLDCNHFWLYDPTQKTVLTAPADTIPLTFASSATGASVVDFAITAVDAMQDGGSSIAVMVHGATATFTRCDLHAGDGAAGGDGNFTGPPAVDADPGGGGTMAGGSGKGGKGAMNMYCDRSGGDGGNGGMVTDGDGVSGGMGDPATKEGGAGGPGNSSTPGGAGTDGTVGTDGPGASGSGTVSASGYSGVNGGEAGAGVRGTSGGGGGGSKASPTANGAGGGGGGAAGCGGNPGHGGLAGGSSIALVSVNATVAMKACTLGTGKGGHGGKGSQGQTGQNGGKGGKGGAAGNGIGSGADGGAGGKGGDSGNGGGGLGGHSLDVAAAGTVPQLAATTCKIGEKGAGGDGGSMTPGNMNPGADGQAAACWDFDADMPCMAVDCPAP